MDEMMTVSTSQTWRRANKTPAAHRSVDKWTKKSCKKCGFLASK
jgi:hypothetical protein